MTVILGCISSCTILLLLIELSALADLMGPYGIRYLGEQLTDLVSSQVKELKVTTIYSLSNVYSCIFSALVENSGNQQGCVTQLAHES